MKSNETYDQYLTALFDKLRDTQEIARENLRTAKKRSKRYYDKKARPYEFKLGDNVYLLREPIKNKLDGQYTGPHRILEVLYNNNVKLEITRGRHRVVHTDKIKLAHLAAPTADDDHAGSSETPASEDSRHVNANSDTAIASEHVLC